MAGSPPIVKDYVAKHGKAPAGLSFSLAALLNFYDGKFVANGEYEGQRESGAYPIRDGADILAILSAAWLDAGDTSKVVSTLLADVRLWGEDRPKVAGLAEQTAAALAQIKSVGVKAAMAAL